ncbi:MAG TPA: exodeoxyribonuclease VII small subunit [Firmicutes bacterium]|jgi:exodeoxyribonuclease VII small subunit|nr:exodeoxyribonuclease VII small subunit [Bacillota bacterium]
MELTFEEAYKKLEEIVEQLETGELTLDQSLALFEEGIALVRHCRRLLDVAEKRVEIILKDDEGIRVTEFTNDEQGVASL